MKLTGQCKQDFEKWWIENRSFDVWTTNNDNYNITDFFCLNFSMQYGVLVDFFDSVDIIIDIHPVLDYNENTYTKVIEYLVYARPLNRVDEDDDPIECKTRREARTQVITKVNKIYNETNR